jgi:type II secretory pathway pseudopilin PulG
VQSRNARSRERGMSLAEALVAIVIFSVAFVTAMMLYQTANRTYLRTDAAAVQQQNVRFALDRMSETLRDAGAGHNMLGSQRIADEQIEGAWESAIFVRGDFDGARETGLETATYPIITTGNDEIVGYVLRKPVPPGGPDPNTLDLQIIADLTPSTGRDAVYTSQNAITGEETRTVKVAATSLATQTSPPYRLERVTFKDDGTPQYEVVAENIFRLSFRYFEDDVTVQPVDFDTAIGGANAERDERARIRRIEVNLTSMTERPDLGYRDETDYTPAAPIATRGHRKFSVSQMIFAPNLGVTGGSHNTTLPVDLPTPTYITACGGHCRTYLISWPASTNQGVTTYRLQVTAPAVGALPAYSTFIDVIGLFYEFTEPENDLAAGNSAPFRTFSFRVAPLAGSIPGNYTPVVAQASVNDGQSVPMKVENVTAAQSAIGVNAMRVAWDPVTSNIGAITASTCTSAGSAASPSAPPSPWNATAVDLTAARVYRLRSDGSNTGADVTDTMDVTDAELGDLANDAGEGSFTDKTAAPCSSYFYRVKACDHCGQTSQVLSDPMQQPATFSIAAGKVPEKPATPSALGPVTFSGGNFHVQLQWAPVTRTADNDEAAVAHYKLERWRRLGESGDYELEPGMVWDYYERLQSDPDSVPAQVGGQNAYYRYYLTAIYDCASPRVSVPSDPFQLACLAPAGNTMSFTSPPNGDVITRPGETSVTTAVATTGSNWTSAKLQVTRSDGTVVFEADGTAGVNSFTFPTWDVSDDQTFPDDSYTLSVSGTVGECITATPISRTISLSTVSCGQRIIPVTPTPWTGNGANAFTGFQFRIENTCPFPVTFNGMTAAWQGVSAVTRLTRVTSGTTTFFNLVAGVSSGSLLPFATPATLAAATNAATPSLSPVFAFAFNNNFTHNDSQNGTPGKFNSVFIHITSPQVSSEQLVDGAAVP